MHRLHMLALTVAAVLVEPTGCGAPAGNGALSPQETSAVAKRMAAALAAGGPRTQPVEDVLLEVKCLGQTDVSMLAAGELCRLRGHGLDVVCLESHDALLRLSDGVKLPLVSAELMRGYERRSRLMIEAITAPQTDTNSAMIEKAVETVSQAMADSAIVSLPLDYLVERLSKSMKADGPERDRCGAIARAILTSDSVRLIGQLRTRGVLEAYQVELRLTPEGRTKRQSALSALPATRPATMPSTQSFDQPTMSERR